MKLLRIALILLMAAAAAQAATAGRVGKGAKAKKFKLGIVLTQSDAETAFNAMRVADYAVEKGDQVTVFLLGKGVDLDRIKDKKYDAAGLAKQFLSRGGHILACGTCLEMHKSQGSELCPVSSMADLYTLIRKSDRVLTF